MSTKRPEQAFVFTKELGERLRRLRTRAGLSQEAVAWRMGRWGKGRPMIVSRLENRASSYPSLGLVVDYLRACRAGFRDIVDLLDKYTALPVAGVKETTQTEVKVAVEPAGPKHVRTPEQKEARNRERYLHRLVMRDVEEVLYRVLIELGDEVKRTSQCMGVCKAGRRWADILFRTRGREKSRQRQLKKERVMPLPDRVKAEWVERARSAIEESLGEKLSKLPEPPEGAHPSMVARPQPADERLLSERQGKKAQKDRARMYRLALVGPDIGEWLQGEHLTYREVRSFRDRLLPELARICEETEAGTPERVAQLASVLAPWRKLTQTETVVRMFFERYEKLRNWTPGG